MQKVKVLAMWDWLDEPQLERIAAVDPRVEMVPALWNEEQRGVPNPRTESQQAERDKFIKQWLANFQPHIKDAEVIYGLRLPDDVVKLAPRLKWVQSYGAGLDFMPVTEILAHGITVTNSSPVNAPPISEFCMTYMLMHAKRMVWRGENQRAKVWKRAYNDELAGKTVGIIGPGHIGAGVAKRAAAFEMRVLATRRTYKEGEQLPFIERVFPTNQLNEMLGQCDYVICSAPLTSETRHMLGDAQFKAMKPGAYFVNISRGSVVDEPALIRALKSGQLSGAGLDVFEIEPLPESSELWALPNVIITPHVTNGLPDLVDRSVAFFCQNLRSYLDGKPLEAVIDPKKGY